LPRVVCLSRRLLPSLPEISQVRRRLVLARGHKQALGADEIVLLADLNVCVALAGKVWPNWLRVGIVQILFVNRPWSGERVIYYGDFVVKYVGIFLVEIDALFEDRLIVVVQWQARTIVDAWSLEGAARLDDEHVIFAVTVLVNPSADRVACKSRLHLLPRPIATVGIDAARVGLIVNENMGGLRRDDVFLRQEGKR